jgi:hypothetical protein
MRPAAVADIRLSVVADMRSAAVAAGKGFGPAGRTVPAVVHRRAGGCSAAWSPADSSLLRMGAVRR